MKCKKFEKWLFRSFDNLLKEEEKEELEEHLQRCVLCQAKRREYQTLLSILKKEEVEEPKPYFWERVQTKIKERRKNAIWTSVKQWSLRAIPLALLIVLLLALALVFISPPKEQELSQSEVLLLRNLNPLQETQILLEAEGLENKNMMIIFSAMEEKNDTRRYMP